MIPPRAAYSTSASEITDRPLKVFVLLFRGVTRVAEKETRVIPLSKNLDHVSGYKNRKLHVDIALKGVRHLVCVLICVRKTYTPAPDALIHTFRKSGLRRKFFWK